MNKSWIEYFFRLCETVASKSKDESHKVGCVIVGEHNNVLSTGFNGYPRDVQEHPERRAKPIKYYFTEHAERNAIYNAARHGVALEGSTLYVNGLPPCTDCTRAIIQSGIKEVYIKFPETEDKNSRWSEEFRYSKKMMEESGILHYMY